MWARWSSLHEQAHRQALDLYDTDAALPVQISRCIVLEFGRVRSALEYSSCSTC